MGLLLWAPICALAGFHRTRLGERRIGDGNVPRLTAQAFDEADDLASHLAWGRGAGRDRHTLLPFKHLGLEILQRFDANGWTAGKLLRNLYETVGVVAARVADDDC